jgi:hypothetical protein
MRVEIWDWSRQAYRIDSANPATIGKWFAEISGRLMTADARMQDCRIMVWPESQEEFAPLQRQRYYTYTQDDLLELSQAILDISAKLGEMEGARA